MRPAAGTREKGGARTMPIRPVRSGVSPQDPLQRPAQVRRQLLQFRLLRGFHAVTLEELAHAPVERAEGQPAARVFIGPDLHLLVVRLSRGLKEARRALAV